MKWPWFPPGRQEIMALLFDAVVLIAVLVAYSFDPSPRHLANGFAPEWDCAAIPKGDPGLHQKTNDSTDRAGELGLQGSRQ